MAEAPSSIFNKKATEKLRNPDDLDKYVRVTNPSVWVVLGACVALCAGLLIWGIFGSVTTSISTTGVVIEDTAMCFLSAEDIVKVEDGDSATFGGQEMKVAMVAKVPLSRDEVKRVLVGDFLVSAVVKDDWVYQVVFDGDTSSLEYGVPLSVNITVERIAPISLVFGNGS